MTSLILGVALAASPEPPIPPLGNDIEHGALAPEPLVTADSMSGGTTSTIKKSRVKRDLPKFRSPGFHLDLRGVTNLPTDIGGGLMLELPFRMQLSATAGIMPEFYQGIQEQTYGAVAEPLRDGIGTFHQAVDRTLFFNPEVAIRPGKRSGFIIAGGYRWLRLSSDTGTSASLASAAGASIPAEYSEYASTPWEIQTTLHQATARLGYEFFISRIVVRFDVGGAFTFKADSSLNAQADLPPGLETQEWLNTAELFADEQIEKYGHTPTVGITLGYRLF